jgi:hypothetical protein
MPDAQISAYHHALTAFEKARDALSVFVGQVLRAAKKTEHWLAPPKLYPRVTLPGVSPFTESEWPARDAINRAFKAFQDTGRVRVDAWKNLTDEERKAFAEQLS